MTIYFVFSSPASLCSRKLGIKVGNTILLISSIFFYTWGEHWLVLVMLTSTLVDYTCGLIISRASPFGRTPVEALEKGGARTARQRTALVLSICTNLSILGIFKYFNFGIANFNAMVDALGLEGLAWSDAPSIVLPLGISFYTFQSLSYTIDVYRGETRATRDLLDFSCFVTLFPQLVAGPIVRYRDIAAQLVDRVVSRALFASGVSRFILGLAKKVLVADTVALAADRIFDTVPLEQLTPGLAWLAVICYTLQIYFDFSGYSDMAIGLGRMFGFKFLENFNYPYVARSIQDFWRRWHMSLSRWFRDYLYIPLGGNRGSSGRIYFNLVIVFFLCGLWHGAEWTFVVWGLYHGAFLVLERLGLAGWINRRWRPIQHVYVMVVAMGGWVLFRSGSFTQAMTLFSAMAGFAEGTGNTFYVDLYLRYDTLWAILVGIFFSAPVVPWVAAWYEDYIASHEGMKRLSVECTGNLIRLVTLCFLLFFSCLCVSSSTYSPFIYFRF